MKNEIQQILKIVQEERLLNAERYNRLLKVFTEEQGLNAHRYHELRASSDDIRMTLKSMVTKDQFEKAFDSLTQDITYLSGGHHKLKKRVTLLEKRVGKLEDRVV